VRRHLIALASLAVFLLGLFSGVSAAAGLYAPNYGSDPDAIDGWNRLPDGSLSPMGGSPFQVVAGSMGPVSGVWSLAFTPRGDRAATMFFFKGGDQGLSVAEDGSLTRAGAPILTSSSTSVAISPDGRFAYVPTREFSAMPAEGIRLYSIGEDGSLNGLATTVSTGEFDDVAMTPDGRFLFATAGNQVIRFAVGPNGALTELGPTAAGGSTRLAVSSDGRFLFVRIGSGGPAGVASYSIGSDGSLTQNGEPAMTGGMFLRHFAVGPNGDRIYMPDSEVDGIVTAAVATDGTLSVIGTAPVENPESVVVSPDDRFLYYGRTSGEKVIGAASIDANGVPAVLPFTTPWSATEATRLVIRPSPTPVARFTVKPAGPSRNSTFDASASARAARFDWDFGDGKTLPDGGPTPTHRYARAGVFEVRLTVADESGCSTEQIYTGQSTTCPGGTEATTTASLDTPPAISGLAVTNKQFAVGAARRESKGAAQPSRKKVKRGTTFRYRLTERARVRFTIERKRPGRSVGGRCRPSTPKNRKRKKCTRFNKLGSIRAAGKKGRNRTRFSGKLKGKKLPPGRHCAVAIATDLAGGKSTPRRVSFRIVAGERSK
jgi:6-phosphogluconolactonase (cycloisomerase 2 family)